MQLEPVAVNGAQLVEVGHHHATGRSRQSDSRHRLLSRAQAIPAIAVTPMPPARNIRGRAEPSEVLQGLGQAHAIAGREGRHDLRAAPARLREVHAQRDAGAVGCGIHHRVRPLVTCAAHGHFDVDVGAWLDGHGLSGASTIRRMRLVNATDSMTVACCQTAVCDAAISGRRWGRLRGTRRRRPDETMVGDDRRAGDRIPTFCREGAFEDAPHPHAAGIDVEAVELVVRIRVDRLLLSDEHRFVFAEDAVHTVAQLRGDELAVESVVALKRPEVVRRAVGLLARSCS